MSASYQGWNPDVTDRGSLDELLRNESDNSQGLGYKVEFTIPSNAPGF